MQWHLYWLIVLPGAVLASPHLARAVASLLVDTLAWRCSSVSCCLARAVASLLLDCLACLSADVSSALLFFISLAAGV